MHYVTKTLSWCAGHRLLNYDGPCANLHGHNYRAEITLSSASLSPEGFVMDFSEIKSVLQTWIDTHWDHGFLVNKHDPVLQFLVEHRSKHYVFDNHNPTAEAMAKELLYVARTMLTDNEPVLVDSVVVWETPTGCAKAT